MTHPDQHRYACPDCAVELTIVAQRVHENSDGGPPGHQTELRCDRCSGTFSAWWSLRLVRGDEGVRLDPVRLDSGGPPLLP